MAEKSTLQRRAETATKRAQESTRFINCEVMKTVAKAARKGSLKLKK